MNGSKSYAWRVEGSRVGERNGDHKDFHNADAQHKGLI